MFTGIIETIGTIQEIQANAKSSILTIKAPDILENTKLGDSIATNGVCLTASKINKDCFQVDVMAETFRVTNLHTLKIGDKVNLERALSLQDRLGGHIVSGHIDGIGTISNFSREENAIWITIHTDPNILKYMIHRGSITVDGVSLTISELNHDCFKVSIIPHTSHSTTLTSKNVGKTVNLENDILAKYIERLLYSNQKNSFESSITEEFLRTHGF